MNKQKIESVAELVTIYNDNFHKKEFKVIGLGEYSYAVIQNIDYLYGLNNKRLCKFLNKLVKEYNVEYTEYTLHNCIDLKDIPMEVADLLSKMAHKKQDETRKKNLIKKEKLLNELKDIDKEINEF